MYSRNTGKYRTKGQRTGENTQSEEPRGTSQAERGGRDGIPHKRQQQKAKLSTPRTCKWLTIGEKVETVRL